MVQQRKMLISVAVSMFILFWMFFDCVSSASWGCIGCGKGRNGMHSLERHYDEVQTDSKPETTTATIINNPGREGSAFLDYPSTAASSFEINAARNESLSEPIGLSPASRTVAQQPQINSNIQSSVAKPFLVSVHKSIRSTNNQQFQQPQKDDVKLVLSTSTFVLDDSGNPIPQTEVPPSPEQPVEFPNNGEHSTTSNLDLSDPRVEQQKHAFSSPIAEDSNTFAIQTSSSLPFFSKSQEETTKKQQPVPDEVSSVDFQLPQQGRRNPRKKPTIQWAPVFDRSKKFRTMSQPYLYAYVNPPVVGDERIVEVKTRPVVEEGDENLEVEETDEMEGQGFRRLFKH